MNEKSPHILNTSATLLGLCFVVLTSRGVLQLKSATYIDDLTAGAIMTFMISCILSFVSMRRKNVVSKRLENSADIFFFIGLFCLSITSILIAFDVID